MGHMKEKFTSVIRKYVPERSVDYCVNLWDNYPFSFKVSKERRSKLGDYRFNKLRKQHIITVNGNLNPYGFLITYIHEVAHLVHFVLKGNNQPPHGTVWKKIFSDLMLPLLHPAVFPTDLLNRLKIHMKNPTASSYSDPLLAKMIKKYDPDQPVLEFYLEEIESGEKFKLNGRTYEKIQKRRTRSLCQEIHSGKRYLIPETAMVKKV
jgi:hypothetical protein